MSNQMPDEVWLDGFENKRFWFAFPHPEEDSEPHMRYIRADLYEQAAAEVDRLRAALAAITAYDPGWSGDPIFAYHIEGLKRIAQEALDHE